MSTSDGLSTDKSGMDDNDAREWSMRSGGGCWVSTGYIFIIFSGRYIPWRIVDENVAYHLTHNDGKFRNKSKKNASIRISILVGSIPLDTIGLQALAHVDY
jgi:hypothetical protein